MQKKKSSENKKRVAETSTKELEDKVTKPAKAEKASSEKPAKAKVSGDKPEKV